MKNFNLKVYIQNEKKISIRKFIWKVPIQKCETKIQIRDLKTRELVRNSF